MVPTQRQLQYMLGVSKSCTKCYRGGTVYSVSFRTLRMPTNTMRTNLNAFHQDATQRQWSTHARKSVWWLIHKQSLKSWCQIWTLRSLCVSVKECKHPTTRYCDGTVVRSDWMLTTCQLQPTEFQCIDVGLDREYFISNPKLRRSSIPLCGRQCALHCCVAKFYK